MDSKRYNNIINSITINSFCKNLREKECLRCSLGRRGNKPIIYRGNINAKILLLAEAPGLQEEEQQSPFRGPAGQLLDKIIEVCCNLNTERDMCLSNVSYCRPVAPTNSGKQNYTPKQDQLNTCWPFIEKFIEIINPKIIIACGRTALMQLTGDNNIRIGQWEGRWLRYRDKTPMFVMTHPASILHMSSYPDKQYEKKLQVKQYMEYFRDTYKEKL